jgi:hypothetical protein
VRPAAEPAQEDIVAVLMLIVPSQSSLASEHASPLACHAPGVICYRPTVQGQEVMRIVSTLALACICSVAAPIADRAVGGEVRVAQACGWYVITNCKPSFEEAREFADKYGAGYVINTSSPDFPNFSRGFFCVVAGPTDRAAALAAAAHWRITGAAPEAYAKNAC